MAEQKEIKIQFPPEIIGGVYTNNTFIAHTRRIFHGFRTGCPTYREGNSPSNSQSWTYEKNGESSTGKFEKI